MSLWSTQTWCFRMVRSVACSASMSAVGTGGLQAGLHSEGGQDYWSRALAQHHRWGRSKNWFGLVATIFERQTLLDIGFDERFVSGEDIELRWRMVKAGHKVGVSRSTVVTHRFVGGGFALARAQFDMDGRGLASMVVKNGWRGLPLLALPAAAAVRGIVSAWRGSGPNGCRTTSASPLVTMRPSWRD